MTTALYPRTRVQKFVDAAERAVAWRAFVGSAILPYDCDSALALSADSDDGRRRIEVWAATFDVALDSYELILMDRDRIELFEPRRLHALVIEAQQIVRIIEARLRDHI